MALTAVLAKYPAVTPPPVALICGVLTTALSVTALVNESSSSIAKKQLEELKEGRPEIDRNKSFAKIVGKCYNSLTSCFIKQKSQPATSLEPETIGAVVEEEYLSLLIS
jgi:hypothetical protein